MVKCIICGFEKEYSIVEHIKHTHKLSSKEYKEKYPNSSVKSDKFVKLSSENMKIKWENPEYRDTQIRKRNVSHNDPDFKKKMSEKIKTIYNNNPNIFSGLTEYKNTLEFQNWVRSDERIKKISDSSKKRWENPDYKEKVINSIKKKLNDGRCIKNENFKIKMSEIISTKHSCGELKNHKNKYKTGLYKSKNNEEFYYASSYELTAMQIFDNSPKIMKWTNKHNIKIKYFYKGLIRNYIPDFIIEFVNGDSYIIEIKGWDTEEVQIKKKYAEDCYNNYLIFYKTEDLKKFINEKF
jgi:hypothetical protein